MTVEVKLANIGSGKVKKKMRKKQKKKKEKKTWAAQESINPLNTELNPICQYYK